MRLLTVLALAALAGGIYQHRQWRAARRRVLLAGAFDQPVIAVVTTQTGIAT
jgi:hypothetical protein